MCFFSALSYTTSQPELREIIIIIIIINIIIIIIIRHLYSAVMPLVGYRGTGAGVGPTP